MFEGDDDDFSFIDEDFLQDVLEPGVSKKLPEKEVQEGDNVKTTTNLQKNRPHVNKNELNEKEFKKLGDVIACSSVGLKPDKDTNENKNSVNVDFELDGFFDDIDGEENFDSDNAQNTPPDSEFTGIQGPNQQPTYRLHGEEKCNRTAAPAGSDFRARILQSLQLNKSKHSDTSSCSNLEKDNAVKPLDIQRAEKRKIELSQDLFNESFESSSKRKTSPVNHTQEREDVQESQTSSLFVTPLKPAPATVRKSVSPGGPVVQKRKFPGPAGILPELGSRNVPVSVQQLHEDDHDPDISKDIVCSQSSADEFTRGPWQQMLEDLKNIQACHTSPLSVFNIRWVLRRAGLRGQAGVRKIPFLAVMVRSIDTTLSDATVLLKDQTGEMSGTIVNSVLDEFSHILHPGCILVLKDVTLLSPVSLKSSLGGGESNRRHYLNITLGTILTIYSSDDSGHVITTTVCRVDLGEFLRQATALKTASTPKVIVEEEEEELQEKHPEQNQQLFSKVNTGFSSPLSNQNYQNTNFRNLRAPTSHPSVQSSPQAQQQRFRFNSPSNNNLRMQSHPPGNNPRTGLLNQSSTYPLVNAATNQSPKTGSPNGLVTHFSNRNSNQFPKFGSSNGIVRPQGSQTPNYQSYTPSTSSLATYSSSRPVIQPSKVNTGLSKQNNFQINTTMVCSQQEENEVKDLLESVDADSLFGDF